MGCRELAGVLFSIFSNYELYMLFVVSVISYKVYNPKTKTVSPLVLVTIVHSL